MMSYNWVAEFRNKSVAEMLDCYFEICLQVTSSCIPLNYLWKESFKITSFFLKRFPIILYTKGKQRSLHYADIVEVIGVTETRVLLAVPLSIETRRYYVHQQLGNALLRKTI